LEKPRHLWIDAICINQNDVAERNAQVALMDRIYSEAKNVCVWLGEKTEDSGSALHFINQVVMVADFDSLVKNPKNSNNWMALSSLMKREWFSRRWVVQEITLARTATIYCGDASVDWADFAVAVSLFESVETEARSISRTIQQSGPSGMPDLLGEIRSLGATRLVEATSNLFRKSQDGQVLQKFFTLEALVSSLASFAAQKPHDTIYAVLALAKGVRSQAKPIALSEDQHRSVVTSPADKGKETAAHASADKARVSTTLDLASRPNSHPKGGLDPARTLSGKTTNASVPGQPKREKDATVRLAVKKFKKPVEDYKFIIDYDKPFFNVCKDFLNFTITTEGSLDIICRPWVPENATEAGETLPSWLLTADKSAFGIRLDRSHSRKNADTLVGAPGLGKRNYNASRSTRVTPGPKNWRFGTGEKARSMYVEGFAIDHVRENKTYAPDGIILHEWLLAGGWHDHTALPPDQFWRTLVADRGPNGLNPPKYYERACQAARNQSVKGSHISTNTLVHYGYETGSVVEKFARRVQEVIWMRRLIITERSLLGLAPELTERQDVICILYGCSVPVILRRCDDEETGDDYYKFIGECYVHGLMDGEAFEIQKAEKNLQTSKRIFELR
jgi:hypothetical protein